MSPQIFFFILLLFIALTATACGWIAVIRIRNSDGTLHGLGLALFAALLFPLLLLDVAGYFVIQAILAPFSRPDPALSLLMSMATWLFLVVLDFVIGIILWRVLRPRNPEIPMPSSPGQNRTFQNQSWTGVWIALCLHGAALVMAMLFFVLLVPRFEHIFADMLGTNLPGITILSISVSHVFRLWGFVFIFVILPMLLAIDLAICWLAQRLGGKKLLVAWALAILLALFVGLAVSFISLILPMYEITRKMGA